MWYNIMFPFTQLPDMLIALMVEQYAAQTHMSNSLGFSSSAKNSKPLIKKKMEKFFEMIIIIMSLTNNFIAAFHGLYLLAAHSDSFQLFLF